MYLVEQLNVNNTRIVCLTKQTTNIYVIGHSLGSKSGNENGTE